MSYLMFQILCAAASLASFLLLVYCYLILKRHKEITVKYKDMRRGYMILIFVIGSLPLMAFVNDISMIITEDYFGWEYMILRGHQRLCLLIIGVGAFLQFTKSDYRYFGLLFWKNIFRTKQ